MGWAGRLQLTNSTILINHIHPVTVARSQGRGWPGVGWRVKWNTTTPPRPRPVGFTRHDMIIVLKSVRSSGKNNYNRVPEQWSSG